MRLLTITAMATFLYGNSASAAIVYTANFGTQAGFTHDTDNPPAAGSQTSPGANFSLSYQNTPITDGPPNFFRTNATGTAIESLDFGGDHQFLSSVIDLRAFDSSTVQIDYLGNTVGSLVFNAASEFFQFFYIADGIITILEETRADGSLDRMFTPPILASGVMDFQVGFRANINGADDGFNITGVQVQAQPQAVPEPSSMALLGLVGLGGFVGQRIRKRRVAKAEPVVTV